MTEFRPSYSLSFSVPSDLFVHFNKDSSCGATMNLSEACESVKACKSFGQHWTSLSLLVQILTKSTVFHLFWTKFRTRRKCIDNEGRDENTNTSCAVTGQTAMEKKLSPYKQNLLIKAVEMMLRKTTTWLGMLDWENRDKVLMREPSHNLLCCENATRWGWKRLDYEKMLSTRLSSRFQHLRNREI